MCENLKFSPKWGDVSEISSKYESAKHTDLATWWQWPGTIGESSPVVFTQNPDAE